MGHDNPTNEPGTNSPRGLPDVFDLTIFIHKLQMMGGGGGIKLSSSAKATSGKQETIEMNQIQSL